LLAFLRKVHRLSDEQSRGVISIQQESNRDLEDVLIKGRYIDAAELGRLVERHILDSLTTVVRWENGTYRFDPNRRWPGVAVTRLSVETGLIEASRRVDEHRRFMATFKDPYQVLAVRDLPDADTDLSDEERELFGIIDGQRSLTEVVEAAPLTEYEAYEALDRMLHEHWVEVAGRRDPGVRPGAGAARPSTRRVVPVGWHRELAVAGIVLAVFAVLTLGARAFRSSATRPLDPNDVAVIAHQRDIRYALELYRRERGVYPAGLELLVEDDWLPAGRLSVPDHHLSYRRVAAGASYELKLVPDR
jgi:hypothetical protein